MSRKYRPLVRGYFGSYKGYRLKSCIEYTFARYLDDNNIKWKYESKTYTLSDGSRYTPDFFVYDANDNLVKIYEVKSRNKESIALAEWNVKDVNNHSSVPCELITENQIKELLGRDKFKEYFEEWREHSLDENPNQDYSHSELTKRKIGLKTKERSKDKEYREQMYKSVWGDFGKRTREAQLGTRRVEYLKKVCPTCGKEFEVPPHLEKDYCSRQCWNNSDKGKEHQKATLKMNADRKRQKRYKIREVALEWALNNKETVLSTSDKRNEISQTLKPLYDTIYEEVGEVCDRTLCKSVVDPDTSFSREDAKQGKASGYTRKRLFNYLKNYVENHVENS